MNIKSIVFFMVALGFISFRAQAIPDVPVDGKAIFMSRCAACHNVNKTLTGPALAGVHERRSLDWIINFVHSSQTVIKAGDKDAIALYEKFNRIPMPDHGDLTEDQIKSIVEFIKEESKSAVTVKNAASLPVTRKPNYVPLSLHGDSLFFVIFFACILLLIGTLLFAVHVKTLVRKSA